MRLSTSENTNKRIAIITTEKDVFSEGNGNDYLVQLCRYLSATGNDVDVFECSPNDTTPRVVRWSEHVAIINIKTDGTADNLENVFREDILSYARRNDIQYDVFHALSLDAGRVAAAVNDITGIPFVLSLEECWNDHTALLNRASTILVSTPKKKQCLLDRGYDENKINVVSMGFDPLKYYPMPASKARRHLNMEPDSSVLLYMLSQHQEINDIVFEAFEEAKGRQRNLEMVVLCHQDMDQDALPEGISMVDVSLHPDTYKYFYAAADLFLTTDCVINGKSNTIYEAMACGTPVLGIGEESIRSCVAHGKTGFIVQQYDSSLIAHRIVHLCRDKDLMQEMKLNAVMESHAMHTWNRTARLTEAAYKKAAHNSQSIIIQKTDAMMLDISHLSVEKAIA